MVWEGNRDRHCSVNCDTFNNCFGGSCSIFDNFWYSFVFNILVQEEKSVIVPQQLWIKDNFRVMKWIACEKSIYKICIKNTCLVLIYSGFYCIIWINKLRLCLFCIKTDDAIEKRERQKICIEGCVIFCRFFYLFFYGRWSEWIALLRHGKLYKIDKKIIVIKW